MKYIFYVVGFFFAVSCWGQKDTVTVDVIEVISPRWKAGNVGSLEREVDGSDILTLADHSGKALSQHGIQIKSYGPSTLSTISLRGGSAQQTLLLWNEIPIRSPMNGTVDFSLIPVNAFDKLEVAAGGNSGIWGAGAVSGLVKLAERPSFDKKYLTLESSLGSFKNYTTALSVGYGLRNISYKGSVRLVDHLNAFTFRAIPTAPEETMRNAHTQGLDIKQSIHALVGDHTMLSLHAWNQRYEREIPRTTVQRSTASFQEDKTDRLQLNMKHYREDWTFTASAGFLKEDIRYYIDRRNDMPLDSGYESWIATGSIDRKWSKRWSTSLNLYYDHTTAYANGYPSGITENTYALSINQGYQYGRLNMNGTLRLESFDGEESPLTPQLAADYAINNQWMIGGKVGYNYRHPTINDRYWTPGGNQELRPEAGWSTEINGQYKNDLWTCKAALYSRHVDEWIIWVPSDNRGIWSPENITAVWSRGVESSMSYRYLLNKWSSVFTLGGNLNYSTVQEAVELPDLSVGDQLWYTPRYQYRAGMKLAYRKYFLHYLHQWNGGASGVNEDLSSYALGDISAGFILSKPLNTELRFNVHNISNTWYQVVERRPMPGRTISINLKLTI